jgi:hypothetical protein
MKNGASLLHFSVSHFSVWLVSVAERTIEAFDAQPANYLAGSSVNRCFAIASTFCLL